MGKKRKSKVVVMERELINSKAYLALKGISPQLLLLFYGRRRMERIGRRGRKKWVCTNAAEIAFTYSEAKDRFGITNSRFTRGIDNLVDKGFIDIEHHGGTHNHDKTIYAISNRWKKYGEPDFKTSERQKDPIQRGYRRPKKIIGGATGCHNTCEKEVLKMGLDHTTEGLCSKDYARKFNYNSIF